MAPIWGLPQQEKAIVLHARRYRIEVMLQAIEHLGEPLIEVFRNNDARMPAILVVPIAVDLVKIGCVDPDP